MRYSRHAVNDEIGEVQLCSLCQSLKTAERCPFSMETNEHKKYFLNIYFAMYHCVLLHLSIQSVVLIRTNDIGY